MITIPPPPVAAVWELTRLGRNKMQLVVPTFGIILTRHEAFRLIGELERMAASL